MGGHVTSCGALRPSGTRQQDLNTLRRAALLRWRRRSPEVPAPIHSRHTRTLFVPAAFGGKDSEMHIYVDDACSSQVQRARIRLHKRSACEQTEFIQPFPARAPSVTVPVQT